MAEKSVVSSKGQVTIPAKVRKALGLKPGDRVAYKLVEGRAELVPVKGTILDAAGSVTPRKQPEDFTATRRTTKDTVARRVAEKRQ
ncbi:MAG: AbrB/MazE/SpoVT family DNA-binding domain-containing protein [Actinobacteria bacterium]|nr:AbrB/MazE/SpoVT family DNA-binding domain-containing protein [Actinomycetota bacterium]